MFSPRLFKVRLKYTSPIQSFLQLLLQDFSISSFIMSIFSIFHICIEGDFPVLNTSRIFSSILCILHLLLHKTVYVSLTLGIEICNILPFGLDILTRLYPMNLIVSTLMIIVPWSTILIPNSRRGIYYTVILYYNHTPSI